MELVDTGQNLYSISSSSSHNCSASSTDQESYLLRLQSPNLHALFPFFGESSTDILTVKLFRQPLTTEQQFNIFVTDTKGEQIRVDRNHSPMPSRFKGSITAESFSNERSKHSTLNSEILATGEINPITRAISLVGFIRFSTSVLYLRPNSGNPSQSISPNLHLISRENNTAFFYVFQNQFSMALKAKPSQFNQNSRRRTRNTEVPNSCRKFFAQSGLK